VDQKVISTFQLAKASFDIIWCRKDIVLRFCQGTQMLQITVLNVSETIHGEPKRAK
jgi:hypothetical protein